MRAVGPRVRARGLAGAVPWWRQAVAGLLGVDRLGGVAQLALSVAGLFASPLATLVGLLLASVGVGAAAKVWDDSLAGQEGMVAKLARGSRLCVGVSADGRDHR